MQATIRNFLSMESAGGIVLMAAAALAMIAANSPLAPLYAFVNAGVSLRGVGIEDLLHSVPLGIAAGLFVGKQLGIFLLCFVAIKLGLARLPDGAGWGGLYGVSILCGVGFTMSLFVGPLAFENQAIDTQVVFDERLGILLGSILSGVAGYLVLRMTLPATRR